LEVRIGGVGIFQRMTPKAIYSRTNLKSIAMFIILGGAIIALLSWLHYSLWQIGGFWILFLFGVACFNNIVIYPTLIATNFYKFTPFRKMGSLKSFYWGRMMGDVGLKSGGHIWNGCQ